MQQERLNPQEGKNPSRPAAAAVNNSSSTDVNHTNQNEAKAGNLTAYERLRAQNIERNQKRLADLGLITENEAKQVIDSAWKNKPAATGTSKPKDHARKKKISSISGKRSGISSSKISTRGSSAKEKRGTAKIIKKRIRTGKWVIPSTDWIAV